MKAKKKISKVLALVCSIALVLSGVYVAPYADATVVNAADEYTVINLADFLGGETQKSWSGSEQATLTAGSGDLDKVTIDGVYNIARYSSVAIGSKSGYRLMIGVNNSSLLYYQFANSRGIVAGGEAKTFDQNTLGCYYNAQDVRIKTTFEFANFNESTGLADLTIRIQIGDYLEEQVLQFSGVTKAEMTRTVFVNANTGALTLKGAPDDSPVVLGIDDFIGGETSKTWTGTNSQLLTAGTGTLDNVTVEGVFNIARYSSVAIGSQTGARLMIGVNNGSAFYYQFADSRGIVAGGEAKSFDQNALGCYYNGQDVPIKVAFEFSKQNYVTGVANVKIKIQIGTYLDEQEMNLSNINMSQLGRNIFVNPNTGAITLKVAVEETETVLGIDDFIGGETSKTWTGTNSEVVTAGTGTLDNVTVEGVFNIARYSNVAIGSQAGARLMIGVNNGSMFYYQFADSRGLVVGGETKTFDQNALGCYYNGQDVPIKVSFEFSKQNYVTGVANVKIKLQIGEYLDEQEMNLSNINMSQLGRNMFVNPSTGAVTLKVLPEASEEWTVLGVKDFVGADTQTNSGTNAQLVTAGEGNLDHVVIDGTFNISRYSNILIGSQAKNRLQFGVNNNYVFYYQYANASGVVNNIKEEFGTSYAGKDVKLRVSFVYSKRNYVASTANVTVHITINDSIEREFVVSNVPMAELARTIYLNPSTGSLTVSEHEEYYDLNTGFSLEGEGLTVNGESVDSVNLKTPGDYYVKGTKDMLFAKYVVIYTPGDVGLDGAVGAKDLVGLKKVVQLQHSLTTKAANKAADVDKSGAVNDNDCEAVRGLLVNW